MVKTTILLLMLSSFIGAVFGGVLITLITRKDEE